MARSLWLVAALVLAWLAVRSACGGVSEHEAPLVREVHEPSDAGSEVPRPSSLDAPRLSALELPEGALSEAAGGVEAPSESAEIDLETLEQLTAPPPDPLEEGDCSLVLTVVDRATGAPVSSDVRLWRIGAPGNEGWSEGDRLQAVISLERGVGQIDGLPPGTYRARCGAARDGGADPPAFEVHGALTAVTLEIDLPRKFRVFVEVLDETGLPLSNATVSPATGSMSIREPGWVRAREPKRGVRTAVLESVEWTNPGEATRIVAGPLGFDLGEHEEGTLLYGASRHVEIAFPGRSSVRCPIRPSADGDGRFLAVSVPIAELRRLVRSDDGRSLDELGARLEAKCTAVAAPPETWRNVEIDVRVECGGHESLQFPWTRTTAASIEHILVRAGEPR